MNQSVGCEAVAAFHDRVEMGRVYHFSKGSVRPQDTEMLRPSCCLSRCSLLYDAHDVDVRAVWSFAGLGIQ
eukprot:1869582-Amphidinium_carterae.1